MNATFLASIFLMLLLATSFAAAPLVRHASGSLRGVPKLPALIVAAAVLPAIGLYAALGSPGIATGEILSNPAIAESRRPPADGRNRAASVSELLAGLEEHLQETPDDAKGWLLLARSYDHLGRALDAAEAYDKAALLGLTDSELEVRLR